MPSENNSWRLTMPTSRDHSGLGERFSFPQTCLQAAWSLSKTHARLHARAHARTHVRTGLGTVPNPVTRHAEMDIWASNMDRSSLHTQHPTRHTTRPPHPGSHPDTPLLPSKRQRLHTTAALPIYVTDFAPSTLATCQPAQNERPTNVRPVPNGL